MSIIEKALDKLQKSGDAAKQQPEAQDNHKKAAHITSETQSESINNNEDNIDSSPELNLKNTNETTDSSQYHEIDIQKLKLFGYLTPDSINIAIAEQYRRIKRPLLINAFDEKNAGIKNRNLIAVTSSIPKEGKSFTSLNLALSIAMELNQTTLFIDADVVRKSNSSFLGVDDKHGLSDYLRDESSNLSEYLLKTNIPDFSILPAGNFSSNINELWASKRMMNFLHELSERYKDRVVILDCSPVLSDSATHILTRQVGQVLFVIEAEKTSEKHIADALQMISDSQYIGLALNKSNRTVRSDYSYYGQVNLNNQSKRTS